MSTKESHERVKAINAQTTEEELIQIYSSWSETYDQEVKSDLGYVAPRLAAEKLSENLKKKGHSNNVNIIDVGCGTGLVCEELHKLGYKNIDGVDFSPELLKLAEGKGVYRMLKRGFMASDGCKNLGIEANQYDAAICIGVFTVGHVKGKGFDDLVHVVKPGGLACFTIRKCIADDPEYGYDEKMDELIKLKKWSLVSKCQIVYHEVNNYKCWLYIYEIL
ncbi:methyltransferase-like protein 27 [Dendronephthya gigantea]|uniref:methyltransferase-like protein 27 n=1 Tax=Dendronephthya gigantea TaxID=151771 RepID=UPI00106B9F32|nr:methyltransferase-like protein 27 [Dendronephthya gigantea]XP_028415233.1 methyltransferase-like protein 27 [Dendronephthya gigantea]